MNVSTKKRPANTRKMVALLWEDLKNVMNTLQYVNIKMNSASTVKIYISSIKKNNMIEMTVKLQCRNVSFVIKKCKKLK